MLIVGDISRGGGVVSGRGLIVWNDGGGSLWTGRVGLVGAEGSAGKASFLYDFSACQCLS